MKQQIDNILSLLLIVVCLSACYENQEGCLDILATNYDVVADDECEDCCTYPNLTINLTQVEGTDNFSLGDTIVNNLGVELVLLDLVYLISDVSLVVNEENLYPPDSTYIISENGEIIYIANNFSRVSRAKANYTIGELKDIGYVSALTFKTGLPDYIDGATFASSVDNDLTVDPDSLQSDDLKYTVQRLQVAKGIEFADTMIYDVLGNSMAMDVSIALDTTYDAGREKVVSIIVDYRKWFENIDFEVESDVDIAEKLRNNLAESFRAQ